MSSTSNSQNLLVNVFRPVYTYSAGTGFTPKLVLSNVDILSAGALQTGQFQLGDSNSNVFLGSNAGTGSNNSNNVGIGVGAMQSKSDSRGTVAIGTNSLTGGSGTIDTVAIGNEVTGGGRSNVILGARSGTLGSNMILLGSGLTTLGDVSGKLYIGSGSLSNSLVYGDFNSRYVGINTVTPSTNLDVSGDASISRWLSVGYNPYQAPRGAVDANGYMYASLGFQAQGGSATYPAFTFIDDSGTGIYKEGTGASGRFAITSQGTKRMDISGDTLYIYANLKATGSVNIGAVDTSAFSFGDGFVRDNATTPQTDVSKAGIRTTTMDVSTILQTSNGMIRVGPTSAPTVDISGSSIRAAQIYGTNFVLTPFVHDGAAGTFDLSSGNLRLNNVLRVSGTNGAIRIGSNAISSTVDISGSNIRADGRIQGVTVTTSAGYVYAPAQSFVSDLSLGLYRVGTNALGFASAGIQRMCISGGNVGIGKAAPVVALEVVGDVSATTYNGPGGTASAPHYTFSDDRTTGFFFPSANQIGFTAGGTERMRISNANIGIGTTAPTTALEISGGTITITSAANGPITIGNGTINVSGTTVVSSTGVFSNSNSTSNSIGGVTLSNFDISMSTTGRILGIANTSNQIGGITLSNNNITYSGTITGSTTSASNQIGGVTLSNFDISMNTVGRILGIANTSNQIGGVTLSNFDISMSTSGRILGIANTSNQIGGITLSNNNITYSGTITGSTTSASNQIGGVTLSNFDISMSTSGRILGIANTSNQIGGVTLSNSNAIVGGFLRNALTPSQFDISGGNISNSGTTRSGNFLTLTASSNNIGGIILCNTRVGIGAAAPDAILDVSGSTGTIVRIANPGLEANVRVVRGGFADGSAISLYQAAAEQGLYSSNTMPLHLYTGGTQRLTILSNGNVGIGTTNPQTQLQVNGNVRVGDGTVSIPSQSFANDPSTGLYRVGANALGFASAGIQRMVISNNNVGIGTVSPQRALDVSSSDVVTAVFRNATTQQSAIDLVGGNFTDASGMRLYHNPTTSQQGIYANNSLPMLFWTSNAERMRILSNGNVGIGTTAPAALLDISSGYPGLMVQNGGIFVRGRPMWGQLFLYNATSQNALVIEDISTGLRAVNDYPGNPNAPSGWRMMTDGNTGSNRLTWQRINGQGGGQWNVMALDPSGYVGIGTTTPAYALDVCGTIRGLSNIVAVATATSNMGTTWVSIGTDLSLNLSYTPKQSTAANVKIVVYASADMYIQSGTGPDSYSFELRNGATTFGMRAVNYQEQNLSGRGTGNNFFGGSSAVLTVSGNVITPINLYLSKNSDDPVVYRNASLVIHELSTT